MYEFIVELRPIVFRRENIMKRYSIPSEGLDVNDAWFEALQNACRDCKSTHEVSSIYLSHFSTK